MFPSWPQVLSELRTSCRTNSTEEVDSPRSNPGSPGWALNMRSQSLLALGIGSGSPHTQRQLIAAGKHLISSAKDSGAKRFGALLLPEQATHASSSRLAALIDQLPTPDEEEEKAKGPEQEVGSHAVRGSRAQSVGESDERSTYVSRNSSQHGPSRSPPKRSAVTATQKTRPIVPAAELPKDGIGSQAAFDSGSSDRNTSSSSLANGSDEEEDQEENTGQGDEDDWAPTSTEDTDHTARLGARQNRCARSGKAALEEAEAQNERPHDDEEEWADCPVVRRSRSVKTKGGVRKNRMSTNPRVLAARRAASGGRKRSEKLTNFSGVTLKNGRCA